MLEYAVKEVGKKMNAEDLEEGLNVHARKGWKVAVSVGKFLILKRKIKIQD